MASLAMPLLSYDLKVVPNGAGTSTRILGQYVRDERLLTLSDAIARLSLYPAQRMEAFAPAFARKGRISIGADADIVILIPPRLLQRRPMRRPLIHPRASTAFGWLVYWLLRAVRWSRELGRARS